MKRIFRYLKGQPKLGLWYPKVSSFDLKAYLDSDYVGANLDRKATTGEAEYIAAAHCRGQVLWIQNQLLDYGFNLMNTKIYIDNESTICIVKNHVFHSKTKHIEIRHHFIRDAYEKNLIQVLKIHTDDNIADLLTKAFDVSSKELASLTQMALGKDESNSLIVDSLLKTIWLSMHHVIAMKHWLFQSKRLLVKIVNDEFKVQALNDEKRVTIKETSIRRTLKFDDEEGISCLANDGIFTGLVNMGSEKISDKEVGQAQDDVSIHAEPSTSKPHKKPKSKRPQPIAPKVPSHEPSPEHQLPSPSNDPIPDADKDRLKLQELMNLCTRLSNKVLDIESEVIDIKFSFINKIEKLEDMVHKLEEENRIRKEKSFKSAKVDIVAPVEDKEESFKQGRMITYMDEDVEVNLEETQAKAYNIDLQHSEKVLSMQDIDKEEPAKVKEVLEVVTAAKLIIEVVTTAEPTTIATQVTKASAPKRRRCVIIQDPRETAASIIMHIELEAKLNANINWNDVIDQVKISERQDNEVMRVQEKDIEEEGNKRQGKSLEKEIAKKQRMDEDAEDLKTHLQIMANDDDDVYTEATPLASKVPVDYQIHNKNNKPYYKIIRADRTHKLFLSFITLLKNFDKEYLETLWKLVKERIETTEPKNFLDDFLLNILKIMFKMLILKLIVHIITLTTTQIFLLVEKKYPLTHFTPKQILNNVRLEVKEESEMSLELLRDDLEALELKGGYGGVCEVLGWLLGSVTKDSGFKLTGFLDANYAGCKDTFKSTSGGAQFLDEKLVSWSLKKQDYTALSIVEA
uniref:Putative ribonuclease H-like domain-containing protein n=1 Tax=Tanacetum cinerariifolium TaxID=118510 RepID=A0A6L2JW67_TANCI|nr:putative ribonuclease H-like domain-containing protein [Tanacetum cinerariifolium]